MMQNPDPNQKSTPMVVLQACRKHRSRATRIVRTGPAMTAREQDHLQDLLLCWQCWESDEAGVLKLMEAMSFSPQDIALVHIEALSHRPGWVTHEHKFGEVGDGLLIQHCHDAGDQWHEHQVPDLEEDVIAHRASAFSL